MNGLPDFAPAAAAALDDLAYAAWSPRIYDVTGTEATYGAGAERSGRYVQVGPKVSGWGVVVFAAGLSLPSGGWLTMDLPVPPSPTARPAGLPVGTGYLSDGGAVNICAALHAEVAVAGRVLFLVDGGSFGGGTNPVTDTVPFSWAAGDSLLVQFEYEAAS